MGTRNLTCVVLDGEFKVAQYCQWDGYPEGQGRTIVEFIKKLKGKKITTFKKNLRNLRTMSQNKIDKLWSLLGVSDGWASMEQAETFKKRYPQFHRDMGADILQMILDGTVASVSKDVSFAQDSLMCEWCYVIDMDNKKLEVYTGFNTERIPKKQKRFVSKRKPLHTKHTEGYYPVRLAKVYKFSEAKNLFKDFKEN
jgi:hypothetical protein